jgi:2-C-methyl-D-erythritol 4-phosphate cytidylyltransferase
MATGVSLRELAQRASPLGTLSAASAARRLGASSSAVIGILPVQVCRFSSVQSCPWTTTVTTPRGATKVLDVTVTRMVAVVLGGGAGNRFGAAMPKQLLTLGGRTLVEHCVTAFAKAPGVDEVLLVMPASYAAEAEKLVGDQVSAVIEGGVTRSDSVRNAIAHLAVRHPPEATGVLFHDAARPLVTQQIIADCVTALQTRDAAGTAIPTSDTIVVANDGVLSHCPPRETLFRAQTPQCFRLSVIARAHELAASDPAFTPTDDCGVVLRYLPDVPVHIVNGSERNIKVTYPADLAIAEALLAAEG